MKEKGESRYVVLEDDSGGAEEANWGMLNIGYCGKLNGEKRENSKSDIYELP